MALLCCAKPSPLSPVKLEVAKREFAILLDLGKADGLWRPCGDNQRVNSVTITDRYPVPNLQHFHHILPGAAVFSKLDFVKA